MPDTYTMVADHSPQIAVVGSLNLDIVVQVEQHPASGQTVLGGDAFRNPGGKGANQAVAAARLGRRVGMIGRIGDDDAGGELLEALRAGGVDVSEVEAIAGVPSGVALITVDRGGDNAIVVSPGANARLDPAAVERAGGVLEEAAVTLVQLEIPLAAVEAAVRLASGLVILNPAPARELPLDVLGAVDVLVPNAGELAELTGGDPASDHVAIAERGGEHNGGHDAVVERARSIRGPGAVVVTLGADGALVVTEERSDHVPSPSVSAIDTTAAGDCFCGALADALARGEDLLDAARWAVAAASVSVGRKGAQASLPTACEVRAASLSGG